MFFNEEFLKKEISKIDFNDNSDVAVAFYNDLLNKSYTIIYHFDVKCDSLFYEAFVKPNRLIHSGVDYAYLKINFLKTPDNLEIQNDEDRFRLVLAWYIYNRDENALIGDENYYDKKYSFVPENLRTYCKLNGEAKEQFVNSRKDFIDLIGYIEQADLNSEEPKNYLKEYLKVKPKTIFNEIPDQKYKYEILNKETGEQYSEEISTTDNIFKNLDNLLGKTILYKGTEYRVISEIGEGDIYIDEFNKLIFYPSLVNINNLRFLYDRDKTFIIVNLLRKTIKVYKFKTATLASLYYFSTQHSLIKMDYIRDILEAKFGLAFTKLFELKKTYNDEAHFLHIDYYVTLKQSNTLCFNTIYKLNHKIVKKEDVIKSYYYHSIIDKFLKSLEALKLPEESNHSSIDLLEFLKLDLTKLKDVANVHLEKEIEDKIVVSNPKISFNVKRDNDWFQIDPISATYTKKEIDKIYKGLVEKKKYIIIRDDIIDLDNLAFKNDLISIFNFQREYESTIPMYELFKLEALKHASTIDINYDDNLTKVIYSIKNFTEEKVQIPINIKSALRSYQYEAVQWLSVLAKNGLGGVLADDMGLGKTLETIAFIESLKENEPVLIVSPKSVTYNWQFEFEKWGSTRKCIVVEGNKEQRLDIIRNIENDGRVYVVSYDTLRNDIDDLQNAIFSLVILDEAQYIKNPNTLKTIAAKRLNSKYKFSLTGTPIENGISDLWSIFDFIMPGYLGSYAAFMAQYNSAFESETKDEELSQILLSKIKPFVFKRNKEDVLKELPPKTTTTITITMADKQQDLYSTYLTKTKLMLQNNLNTSRFRVLQGILRLREICVDPSVFLLNYDEIPSKISFCLDIIHEYVSKNQKIIIYSSFVSILTKLKNLLKTESIPNYMIIGDTSAKDRLERAESFNTKDNVNVMLVSLKAGGVGLNLTGAECVVFLDPWWNAAAEEQAADRAYRLGQTKPVSVYKLICHNTIEEKILLLQQRKSELFDKLIKDDVNGIKSLSDEDIRYIFS